MDGDELLKVLKEVYGHSSTHVVGPRFHTHFDEDAKKTVDELVRRTGHGITQATFVEFAATHPNLLFPAFSIQKTVRR